MGKLKFMVPFDNKVTIWKRFLIWRALRAKKNR